VNSRMESDERRFFRAAAQSAEKQDYSREARERTLNLRCHESEGSEFSSSDPRHIGLGGPQLGTAIGESVIIVVLVLTINSFGPIMGTLV
jgi:hypothetical protein